MAGAGSIDLGLQGSTVVVTGAGSGIGAAAAGLLGAAGVSVVLVGRREAMLRQRAEAIERSGGRAVCVLSPVSWFLTGAVIPLDGGQVIPRA
jgi:NAD(P)-dependent dehydrogenase (short-subunit alcohol dehydrogenase family)